MLAEVTAATEDQIAATFDQLARQQPQRAAYLRSVGESARRYAARERKRLANQPGGTTAPVRAAGLITNPEVRWRIEAAVSELDEVIRETRNVVFQKAQDSVASGGSLGLKGWTRKCCAVCVRKAAVRITFVHVSGIRCGSLRPPPSLRPCAAAR